MLYKTLGERIIFIDHDYGDVRQCTYTLFAPRNIEEVAYKAASMYSTVDELERSIIFGSDWVELEKGLQCGHAGVYDRDQTYWQLAWITGEHENLPLSEIKMKIVREVLKYVSLPTYQPRSPDWNDSYLRYRDKSNNDNEHPGQRETKSYAVRNDHTIRHRLPCLTQAAKLAEHGTW